MKLTSIDLDPEEVYTYNRPDSPRVRLSVEDVRLSDDTPTVVKYNYIDLESTEYNFKQAFCLRDTQEYFKKMQLISSNTINELRNMANELHFRRTDIKGNLGIALKKLFKNGKIDDPLVKI